LSVAEASTWRGTFQLVGTCGCDESFLGPPAGFSIDEERHRRVSAEGKLIWSGQTSFVAYTGEALCLTSVLDRWTVQSEKGEFIVVRDQKFCELANPGPFLAAPIQHADGSVIGVVRVLRRSGEAAFGPEIEKLKSLSPLLAITMLQEIDRLQLIGALGELSHTYDEDPVREEQAILERVATQAGSLVHGEQHHVAIFFEEAPGPSARRFSYRSPRLEPSPNPDALQNQSYTEQSDGFTAEVIKTKQPVLSTNIDEDLKEPDGKYRHVRHERKPGETPAGSTRSWLGVPILEHSQRDKVIGVIRVASTELAAFSRQDEETLGMLCNQTSLILSSRRAQRQKHEVLKKMIELSSRPVVGIALKFGKIVEFNEAAEELLDRPAEDALDKPVVDIVYGGYTALARSTLAGIRVANARGRSLRNHYSLCFKKTDTDIAIPIPVRLDATVIHDPRTRTVTGSIGYLEDLGTKEHRGALVQFGAETNRGFTIDKEFGEELRQLQALPAGLDDMPILIIGETGTGKELIVDELHHRLNPLGKLRKCNCAEFPESVIESELFGTVKGAFTGATNRAGILSHKDDPEPSPRKLETVAVSRPEAPMTIFLDEIAELSLAAQAKLLRVLDKHVVRRVGAIHDEHIDVRVIAATSADLAKRVENGTFRADLMYRLRGLTIRVPALRHRKNDIMLLAMHFIRQQDGADGVAFSSEAIQHMMAYEWPGNVRELRWSVRAAFAVHRARGGRGSGLIDIKDLPAAIRGADADSAELRRLRARVAELEKHLPEDDSSRRPSRESVIILVDRTTEDILRLAINQDPTLYDRLRRGDASLTRDLRKICQDAEVGSGKSRVLEVMQKLKEEIRQTGRIALPRQSSVPAFRTG
jgi:transcriptional regulator with PAS, ATPase and Fis domain